MSLKSFRLMLEYRLKIALLFLQPAAARDRKPLPQSTVLTLSTGQATIASPDHPNSFIFLVTNGAAGGAGLCQPVPGIACCSDARPWYTVTNRIGK